MKNDEIVFLEKDDFRLAFKTFYDNCSEDEVEPIDLHFGTVDDYNLSNKELICKFGNDDYYAMYKYRFPSDIPITLEMHLYVVCEKDKMIYFPEDSNRFFSNLPLKSIEFKNTGQNKMTCKTAIMTIYPQCRRKICNQ